MGKRARLLVFGHSRHRRDGKEATTIGYTAVAGCFVRAGMEKSCNLAACADIEPNAGVGHGAQVFPSTTKSASKPVMPQVAGASPAT